MALQQSSKHTYYHSTTTYHNLPVEITLHILKFLDLETLVDTVRYIDKKHRFLVIDILRNYKLKQEDCDSYWFEFIKKQNTLFLHKYLKPQNQDTMIRSSNTNINSLPWINYLEEVLTISIEKNNYLLYVSILSKYFNCRNIRQYITNNSLKWYLSPVTTSFIDAINFAITHNAISIIELILDYPVINFRFNKDDLEEKTFLSSLVYSWVRTAILHNKVDVLKYFTLRYIFTNQHYNDLFVLCANNLLIDTAIQENKPHVLDYIITKLTNPSNSVTSDITYNIPDTIITKFIDTLSITEPKHNIIIYFATKFSHKLDIIHYINILSVCQIDIVKKIIPLYLESHSVFPDCPLFTTDALLDHDKLMSVILHIKSSLFYNSLKLSLKYKKSVDTVIFLRDILYTNCIKYNITEELFVKYIVLDCIKISIETHYNEIETKQLYSALIKNLPSIYDIDNIKSIMSMISVKYSAMECYKYFHNLFIQKSVLSRKIYIELLKDNLYLSFQNGKYSSLYFNVLTFILLKLKENGEINSCQDDKYIPLAIHFIMNKYFYMIEIMCNNGFIVSGHNDYLQIAIKTRSFNLIKVLITFGADISSHDYAVLHYALKQNTPKLALFIKEKLTSDNKLQEYLDWETNPNYKIMFDKT